MLVSLYPLISTSKFRCHTFPYIHILLHYSINVNLFSLHFTFYIYYHSNYYSRHHFGTALHIFTVAKFQKGLPDFSESLIKSNKRTSKILRISSVAGIRQMPAKAVATTRKTGNVVNLRKSKNKKAKKHLTGQSKNVASH